ncbi:hypothetical protein [Pseudomonas sp. FP1740]|uniref:hypothetical protein n=1 Tax=Pseudomonas sp. FP1740 TaxID=2954078 RepID=UPI002735664F|nr:hypothetical protein [Pseudomonas sp. FP1740]WLG43214.1 hypothetical protein PSH69_20440 [Pseudomonas sp. FP1740]
MELVQDIIRRVASGSAGETAGGHALMLSNRFLKASVLAEKSVNEHYEFLKPLIGAFKALKHQLATHQINTHMLALMGPNLRQGLVTAVLGLTEESHKALAIAGLVNGYQASYRPPGQ